MEDREEKQNVCRGRQRGVIMKNRKRMAVVLIVIVLALAACSNSVEEVTAMENNQADEASANDLIVDSLGFLLNEDEASTDGEEQASEEEEEQASEEEEEQAEEMTEQKEVMIYYGNGASDMLSSEKTEMEQITADKLLDALLKHNIVSLGTKVNVFEEEDADGLKRLNLDLSKTFRDYLKTMTQEGEKVIMSSVAATFLEAYGADEIVITVDGKVLETEHASYEEPIRFSSEIFIAPLGE